jgi:putative transposase
MVVRWYVAYPLSYRNIEELLAERDIPVDHAALKGRVIEYSPWPENQFRQTSKKPVGTSWRMDETYIKCNDEWVYLYRAVDKEGNTVDSILSKNRVADSARSFFAKSIKSSGMSGKVAIDKSEANQAGFIAINLQFVIFFMILVTLFICKEVLSLKIDVRQIKYLNNIVEQYHQGIKRITKFSLGFKAFYLAEVILSSTEFHHILRKKQHINADMKTVFE